MAEDRNEAMKFDVGVFSKVLSTLAELESLHRGHASDQWAKWLAQSVDGIAPVPLRLTLVTELSLMASGMLREDMEELSPNVGDSWKKQFKPFLVLTSLQEKLVEAAGRLAPNIDKAEFTTGDLVPRAESGRSFEIDGVYEGIAWHLAMLADLADVADDVKFAGQLLRGAADRNMASCDGERFYFANSLTVAARVSKRQWQGLVGKIYSAEGDAKVRLGDYIQTISVRAIAAAQRVVLSVLQDVYFKRLDSKLANELRTVISDAQFNFKDAVKKATVGFERWECGASTLDRTDGVLLAYTLISQADLAKRLPGEKEEDTREAGDSAAAYILGAERILSLLWGETQADEQALLASLDDVVDLPIPVRPDHEKWIGPDGEPVADHKLPVYSFDYSLPVAVKCAAELAEVKLQGEDHDGAERWLRRALSGCRYMIERRGDEKSGFVGPLSERYEDPDDAEFASLLYSAYVQDALAFSVAVALKRSDITKLLVDPVVIEDPKLQPDLPQSARLVDAFTALVRAIVAQQPKSGHNGHAGYVEGENGEAAVEVLLPGQRGLSDSMEDLLCALELTAYFHYYCHVGVEPGAKAVIPGSLLEVLGAVAADGESGASAALRLMSHVIFAYALGREEAKPKMVNGFLSALKAGKGCVRYGGTDVARAVPAHLWQEQHFGLAVAGSSAKELKAELLTVSRPGKSSVAKINIGPECTLAFLRWIWRGCDMPEGGARRDVMTVAHTLNAARS